MSSSAKPALAKLRSLSQTNVFGVNKTSERKSKSFAKAISPRSTSYTPFATSNTILFQGYITDHVNDPQNLADLVSAVESLAPGIRSELRDFLEKWIDKYVAGWSREISSEAFIMDSDGNRYISAESRLFELMQPYLNIVQMTLNPSDMVYIYKDPFVRVDAATTEKIFSLICDDELGRCWGMILHQPQTPRRKRTSTVNHSIKIEACVHTSHIHSSSRGKPPIPEDLDPLLFQEYCLKHFSLNEPNINHKSETNL